jgi:GNAT superfamily N-acetyltransferase
VAKNNLIDRLVVRSYNEGDEEIWLYIVNGSLKACPGYEQRSLADFLRWKRGGDFDEEGLLFAEVDGEVIGTIAAAPLRHLAKRKGRITDLAVLPTCQRNGVGSKLLGAALNYLKRVGMEEAEAWSWNVPAFLNFYKKHDFQPVRRYLAIYWDLTRPLPEIKVNKEIDVKRATIDDIKTLAELASKAYRPYWDWWYEEYGGPEKVKAHWKKRAKAWIKRGYAFFLAYLKGKPVGFSAAQIDKQFIKEKGMKMAALWGGVAVLSEYRQRYIGSRLLMKALTFLKEHGMEKAMVGTFSYLDFETPAVRLYIKSGGRIRTEFVGLTKRL